MGNPRTTSTIELRHVIHQTTTTLLQQHNHLHNFFLLDTQTLIKQKTAATRVGRQKSY